MNNKNHLHWLGLRSYEEKDAELFFGRELESEQLCRMVSRETLTTIFSPSGTGKTSLLRAGVFPKLRQAGYFPIRLRLDHTTPGLEHSRWLRNQLEDAAKCEGLELDSIVPAQASEDDETFWEYMHRVELWDSDNNPVIPVIVLDQFEEIFTVGKGRAESAEFLQVLADLVERRLPRTLRQSLDFQGKRAKIPTEYQEFKIILALREDFVAHLDDLRKAMPSIMHNRYPLHSLTGEQALQVVMEAGDGIVEEDVAHKIVKIVAKADEEGDKEFELSKLIVEANLLSLVCQELDQQRIQDGLDFISADGLEHASVDILRRFYSNSFDGLERSARIFVEDQLLTKTGFRKSQPIDDATAFGLSEEARIQLVDRHVLRKVERRDMPRIELTHDLLAGVVKESRDLRHEYEENLELKRVRKKQRRRIQLFASTTLIFIMVSIAALFYANRAVNAEAESEKMLDFMANDLYDRLLPIGRLDILEVVAAQAYEYYDNAKFDRKNRSTVRSRALVLNKMANVLARKGNITEAINVHEQSIALIAGLLDDHGNDDLVVELIRMKTDLAGVINSWAKPHDAMNISVEVRRLLGSITSPPIDGGENSLLTYKNDLILASIYQNLGMYQETLLRVDPILEKLLGSSVQLNERMSILASDLYKVRSQAYAGIGTYSKAVADARKSLNILNELSRTHPTNDEFVYRKALALKELGRLHFSIGDFEGAKDKFEPSLAIAEKRISSSPKNLSEFGAIRSQWSYLKADLMIELGQLWLSRIKWGAGDDFNEVETLYFLSVAEKYYEDAISLVMSDEIESRTLPAELAYIDALILSTHIQESRFKMLAKRNTAEGAKEWSDFIIAAIKELEKGLGRFESGVLAKNDIPVIALGHARGLRRVAQLREKHSLKSELQKETPQGKEILKQALLANPAHQVVRGKLAEFYELSAKSNVDKGKIRQAISDFQEALRHRSKAVDKSDKNQQLLRAKARVSRRLADVLVIGEKSKEIIDDAINLYSEAYKIWGGLNTGGFLRTADRLDAAGALFSKAKLLQFKGEKEEAKSIFKAASNMGLMEATSMLADLATNPDERKSLLVRANKQKRKTFLLPCILKDEIKGDIASTVNRHVYSKVVITESDEVTSGAEGPLEIEKKRLLLDLMLTIEPKVQTEIYERNKFVYSNPGAELSLARITDYALISQALIPGRYSPERLVNLQSPVSSKYPKITPTVFGSEVWFRWDYKGTADELRDFHLQVATSKDFKGKLVVDEPVSGTSYRYNFLKADNSENLNRVLYWRVRHISGVAARDFRARENEWSLTQQVEVYESIWKRILHTGKLRIGVTQFDGDLLKLKEEGATKFGDFDGEVLEYLRSELSKKWRELKQGNDSVSESDELEFDTKVYGWDGMFEAVSRNEVDFSFSTITRTLERERRYGIKFSEPYFETQLAIVYRKKDGKLANGVSINSIEDVQHIKLMANEGFRGAEIGELIVGGNLEEKGFQNLELFNSVLNEDNSPAAIIDLLYLQKKFKNKPELMSGIGVYELKQEHYTKLLEIEKNSRAPDLLKIKKLQEIHHDYGTAEWEQYAAATSDQDDGQFLKYLNMAILESRRSGALRSIYKKEGFEPPERLLGPNQIPEEIRRLSTVVPVSPNNQSDVGIQEIRMPSVLGEEIGFKWEALNPKSTLMYRFQVAKSRDFLHDTVFNKITGDTSYVVQTTNSPDFSGELYWRAKQLNGPGETDKFPQDGWSTAVKFEHYGSSIERVRATGILRVGVNVSNGFSVFKGENHEFKGFDIEIMDYLADYIRSEIGLDFLEVKPIAMNFSDMFLMVGSQQLDIAISGITSTRERERQYGIKFSTPYCKTRQAAIWVENEAIPGITDLIGKPFIVLKKTRAEMIVERFSDESMVTKVENIPKAYLLEKLISGHAVATITDYPTAIKLVDEYNKHSPDKMFRVRAIHDYDLGKLETQPRTSLSEDAFVDWYGIPMQEDQKDLINLVNQGLHRLRNLDYEILKEIFEKYQTFDNSRYPEPPFELKWESTPKISLISTAPTTPARSRNPETCSLLRPQFRPDRFHHHSMPDG